MKNPSSYYLHRLLTDCVRLGPDGEPTFLVGNTLAVLDDYAGEQLHDLCQMLKPLLSSVNGECYLGKDEEEDAVYKIRKFMQSIGQYDEVIHED